tara:strand:- start:88 stop:906 length:819 start_codon:yes stop_codon:yes gene_type:complete
MKNRNDENFPVTTIFIPLVLRKHVHLFYNCVRSADDIADSAKLTPKQKTFLLTHIDGVLRGTEKSDKNSKSAFQHRQSAEETGVTVEHARHLLQAFMMDVTKSRYRNWSELINYCQYSAAPVGRYLLDLHGCEKNSQTGTDSLCIALQLLNHLQDCKIDYVSLNRVYIPEEFFKIHETDVTALEAKNTDIGLRRVLDKILIRTDELILVAKKEVWKISHRGLRFQTGVIIAIAEKLSEELRKRDPISERVELTKIQYFLCFLKGFLRMLMRS